MGASLTPLLLPERHDHSGAAFGAGFRWCFRGVRTRVNPTLIRPPDLVSGCLVRDYLAAILPGLADLPIQRVPALTPGAWRRIPVSWVGWRGGLVDQSQSLCLVRNVFKATLVSFLF